MTEIAEFDCFRIIAASAVSAISTLTFDCSARQAARVIVGHNRSVLGALVHRTMVYVAGMRACAMANFEVMVSQTLVVGYPISDYFKSATTINAVQQGLVYVVSADHIHARLPIFHNDALSFKHIMPIVAPHPPIWASLAVIPPIHGVPNGNHVLVAQRHTWTAFLGVWMRTFLLKRSYCLLIACSRSQRRPPLADPSPPVPPSNYDWYV
jgi:hypothetical protein